MPDLFSPLTAALAACGICAVVLFLLLRSRVARSIVDRPDRVNAMHTSVMPRIGGLAIVLAVTIVSFLVLPARQVAMLLACALLLATISLVDDRRGLPVSVRLMAHVVMAMVAVAILGQPSNAFSGMEIGAGFSWASGSGILLAAGIVWATNLFNFMDGTDGLAGGMGVIGFGAYALVAGATPEAATLACVCAALAGACLGFLAFNFPPARVFMGDAGSIPLGFLAATLGIQGVLTGVWSWWFPVLAFAPFLVDATLTLLKRVMRREKVWLAHRQHYYQRLVLSGWSHKKTALAYYLVMALTAACALAVVHAKAHLALAMVAVWVVIYVLLLFCMERRFALKKNKENAKQD